MELNPLPFVKGGGEGLFFFKEIKCYQNLNVCKG